MTTYLIINCIVLLALVPGLIATRTKPTRTWWLALIVLLIITAIFDNIIIGLGIVGYNHAAILGIFIGNAPIEDFFYAVVAIILVPTLWQKGAQNE